MSKIKVIFINLFILLAFDQVVGFFLPKPAQYLNKAIYSWNGYPTNYRNYFVETKKNGKTYFKVKEKKHNIPYEKRVIAKDKIKVLGIGDSFTAGQGVKFEDTFISKISHYDKKIAGINLAIGGDNIGDIYKVFNKSFTKANPDIVIYGYCLNDIEIDWNNGDIQKLDYDHENNYPQDHGLKWDFINKRTIVIDKGRNSNIFPLIKWSPILSRLYKNWELKEISKNTLNHYKDIYNPLRNKRGIDSTLSKIKIMNDKSIKNNSKFIVVVFPLLFWPNGQYELKESQEYFLSRLKKNNIEYIDISSKWQKYSQEELWVHPVDQHPNDLAHDIVAKEILKYISAL
jgi:lysophospholipase L1-like esterase